MKIKPADDFRVAEPTPKKPFYTSLFSQRSQRRPAFTEVRRRPLPGCPAQIRYEAGN